MRLSRRKRDGTVETCRIKREREFGDTCCEASLCIAWKNNANANAKLYMNNLAFLTMRTVVRWINDGLTLIDFNFHFTTLNDAQLKFNINRNIIVILLHANRVRNRAFIFILFFRLHFFTVLLFGNIKN